MVERTKPCVLVSSGDVICSSVSVSDVPFYALFVVGVHSSGSVRGGPGVSTNYTANRVFGRKTQNAGHEDVTI